MLNRNGGAVPELVVISTDRRMKHCLEFVPLPFRPIPLVVTLVGGINRLRVFLNHRGSGTTR
jgi:hypothetical protein